MKTMKLARIMVGLLAIICLAVALNTLMLKEEAFSAHTLIPLALSIVLGTVWLALRLTQLVGSAARERTLAGVSTVAGSIVFFLICLVVYALVLRIDASWDLTREGRRELATQTVQVLQGLDTDVDVLCFFVDTGDSRIEAARKKTRFFLERCARHTPHLNIEFLDPQTNLERLEALGIPSVSAEGLVVLRAGARRKLIPLSDVTARLEERDFVNGLIHVVRESQPRILFLTGHRERDIQDGASQEGGAAFVGYLQREAYEVGRFAIPLSDPRVPADCDVLVINGPRSELYPAEVRAIDEFLDRGGRLLVLIDPWIVPESEARSEVLRPWLRDRLGIELGLDTVVSRVRESTVAELLPDIGLVSLYAGYEEPGSGFRGSFEQDHPVTRGFDERMVLFNARTVSRAERVPEGTQVTEILRTLPDTWAEEDLERLAEGEAVLDEWEEEGPLSVAAAAVRRPPEDGGRAARAIVVGDSYFATNGQIGSAGHHNFVMNAMAWLTETEELIAIRPSGTTSPAIILSRREEQVVAWLASLGVTQVVAAAGVAVFFLRRRYQ